MLMEALFIFQKKVCLPNFKQLYGMLIAKVDGLHICGTVDIVGGDLNRGATVETTDEASFSVHAFPIGFLKFFLGEEGKIKV